VRGWIRLPGTVLCGAFLIALMLAAGCVTMTGVLDSSLSIDLSRRLLAPSTDHFLGTDALGRDVLAQICAGSLSSLGIAGLSVCLGAAFGVPLGLMTAVRGGAMADLIARANDVVFAFPSLLLAVLLSASLGPGVWTTVIAIGVFNIPVFARLAYGQAAVLMRQEFILAARMAGRTHTAIAFEHLLPNVLGLTVVQLAIQMSLAIVAESGLSYVGLGVQPPNASWGRMLADAQTLISIAPWLVAFPGAALALAVLSLNIVADGLASRWTKRREPSTP
jgi:peptide/nickel transport system permease protein